MGADELKDALALPPQGSAVRRSGGAWHDSGSKGFPIRPLLHDDGARLRSCLMRIEPGASAPLHSHEETEQIYVLEGRFSDGEMEYGPGDFIVRAPGAMHAAHSEEGALILIFYAQAGGAAQ